MSADCMLTRPQACRTVRVGGTEREISGSLWLRWHDRDSDCYIASLRVTLQKSMATYHCPRLLVPFSHPLWSIVRCRMCDFHNAERRVLALRREGRRSESTSLVTTPRRQDNARHGLDSIPIMHETGQPWTTSRQIPCK